VVNENGTAIGYSANVSEIAYVNDTIWQENASHLWWSWNGTGWVGSGTSASPLSATQDIVIMPMDDSITEGTVPGGYRAPLYTALTGNGNKISYVGDQTTNPGGGLPSNQINHEGIGGDTSVDIHNQIDSTAIVQSSQPDIVTLLTLLWQFKGTF
jgi:hypothetical protein